jgi:hypothetical protein
MTKKANTNRPHLSRANFEDQLSAQAKKASTNRPHLSGGSLEDQLSARVSRRLRSLRGAALAMAKKAQAKQPLPSGASYEGPLTEPIIYFALGADAEDYLRKERSLKLPLLLKVYRIDKRSPKRWEDLAWALACDHVTGMQVAVRKVGLKRGRKPSWERLGRELLRDVDALRKKKGINIKEALRELHADKAKGWHRFSLNSLGPRYREAARAERKLEARTFASTRAFLDKVLGNISWDDVERKFKDLKIGRPKIGRRRN